MACFPAIVKNEVFVAKICKYSLSESSEGFWCGPRKPTNPCHPGLHYNALLSDSADNCLHNDNNLHFFATKTSFFTIGGKQAICGCQKAYTHTGTFPQTPFLMFRYILWLCTGCTKALQKWALWKLFESSTKALWKLSESSLKTLRKQALWKLSESSTKAGSTKALWKLYESSPEALRKLSESSPKALWKLYESRLYESSLKDLRKLSESPPKALRKLSESSPKALWKLSGNSTKAIWKRALQKLSESRLTLVGSPSKASWLRYAFKKNIRDYLGIFPNMGGGSSQFPKLKTKKKCP